jgi:magnesium transporter
MYKILKSTSTGLDELELSSLDKGAWIDVVAPDAEEIKTLSEATGMPLDLLTAPLDREEKSRVEIDDESGTLLVLVDIPIFRSNKDYETLPLGIIANHDYLVTICLEANGVTVEFNQNTVKTFSTLKKTRFLFQILFKSATLYLKYIRNIMKRTDDLEQHLRQSLDNAQLISMLDLQKSLTYFNTSLRSDYMVTEKLLRLRLSAQAQHVIKMYEADEDLLEDVIIEYKQAIEMVEQYSQILNSMMEVFASIISNNLNLVMRFLTSVTIILAIPTFISSLWGMNVPVPFADNPYGFIILSILAVLITACAAYWLWKRNMF